MSELVIIAFKGDKERAAAVLNELRVRWEQGVQADGDEQRYNVCRVESDFRPLVTAICGHLLCELIGGACSLATGRSRGCRPNLTAREVAPEVIDEVRALVAAIDPGSLDDRGRAAAARLAQLIRREALDDRNLFVIACSDELDFAPALVRLCERLR